MIFSGKLTQLFAVSLKRPLHFFVERHDGLFLQSAMLWNKRTHIIPSATENIACVAIILIGSLTAGNQIYGPSVQQLRCFLQTSGAAFGVCICGQHLGVLQQTKDDCGQGGRSLHQPYLLVPCALVGEGRRAGYTIGTQTMWVNRHGHIWDKSILRVSDLLNTRSWVFSNSSAWTGTVAVAAH